MEALKKERKFTDELEAKAEEILKEFGKSFDAIHAPDDVDAGEVQTMEKIIANQATGQMPEAPIDDKGQLD
jgi:hypothetical protein